jgi:hypothetical protein
MLNCIKEEQRDTHFLHRCIDSILALIYIPLRNVAFLTVKGRMRVLRDVMLGRVLSMEEII